MKISIDGPSGAGKTSIAKEIARILNIQHIDTGSMYRAIAYKLNGQASDYSDEYLVDIAKNSVIEFKKNAKGEQTVVLDGMDISENIRSEKISSLASEISVYPLFRKEMVELQREMANKVDSVLEGRDIGSVVLPDADYKLYINADPKIRANRRMKQLQERGFSVGECDHKKILEDIIARDERDMSREHSPLIVPENAIIIDNSDLSMDDIIEKIISIIRN